MGKTYLLIAGSRNFEDYNQLAEIVDKNLFADGTLPPGEAVIVEGGAKGADEMARKYALCYGLEYIEFYPDWGKYGRAAGPKRNDAMVAYVKEHGGKALFFWDGQSKGTKQCIKSAMKAGIPVTIWNTAERRYMESWRADNV